MSEVLTRTQDFSKLRAEVGKAIGQICRIPVITSNEEAEIFRAGIQKLRDLSEKDLERIGKIGVEEYVKDKAHDEETRKSLQVVISASEIMAKSLGSVSDFVSRKPNKFLEKAFHNETGGNLYEQYTRLIDQMADIGDSSHIDAGWMPAYNMVNAGGTQALRVRDLVHAVRFYELGPDEDPPLTSIGGGPNDDLIHPRRFGGGVKMNTWDSQFAMFSANEILANIRLESMRLYNWNGYKTLSMIGSNTFEYIEKYSPSGLDALDARRVRVQNMIHTLNEAALKLKIQAAQMPENPGSGYPQDKTEARLPVSVNTPVFVYYNFQHESTVQDMMAFGYDKSFRGDGLVEGLIYPFTFVSSMLVPKSGAFTNKGVKDKSRYDEWGAFGPVRDTGSQKSFGVKLVLPGMRNFAARFQGITFGRDANASAESEIISAFERYGHIVDDRQHMHVELLPADQN